MFIKIMVNVLYILFLLNTLKERTKKENMTINIAQYKEWCCNNCESYNIIPNEEEQKSVPYCSHNCIDKYLTYDSKDEKNDLLESLTFCNDSRFYCPK